MAPAESPQAQKKWAEIRGMYARLRRLHEGTVEYETLSQQIHAASHAYMELTGELPLPIWNRRKTDKP
jgi:hypothetical protein